MPLMVGKTGSVQESVAHLNNHIDYQNINLGVPHFLEHSRKKLVSVHFFNKSRISVKSASEGVGGGVSLGFLPKTRKNK